MSDIGIFQHLSPAAGAAILDLVKGNLGFGALDHVSRLQFCSFDQHGPI